MILKNGYETVRVLILQRTQQYYVHDTEDGRVGADTQRQRHNGYHGEGWRLSQLTQRVMEIKEHGRCQD